MSNFNFNSVKLTCSRQPSLAYVLPTVNLKPLSPEVKIRHRVFSIYLLEPGNKIIDFDYEVYEISFNKKSHYQHFKC